MDLGRIGMILLVSLAAYLAYFALKEIFLTKLKVNKWIIFAAALIILFVPNLIGVNSSSVYSYIISGIFVILLLWFLDLNGPKNKSGKNNEVIIRPKKKVKKNTNQKKKD